MANSTDELREPLQKRGEALSFGVGFSLSERLGFEVTDAGVVGVDFSEPDGPPEAAPSAGVVVSHRCRVRGAERRTGLIGWFFGEDWSSVLEGKDLAGLGRDLADQLAADSYRIESTTVHRSTELWADHLAGELPPEAGWIHFRVAGLEDRALDLWLSMSLDVVRSLFAGVEPDAAKNPPPQVVSIAEAKTSISPGVRRLLRTQVPLIVTLATKEIPTSKLLELGPGTLIEFDKACDEPLLLSVNNLPIGFGEAVKISDHFGLRITAIVPKEERAARLGGKWRF